MKTKKEIHGRTAQVGVDTFTERLVKLLLEQVYGK